MALDSPEGSPSTLERYELLKELADAGYGSTWIARTDEGGDPPPLYTVLRVHKHLVKKPEAAEAFVADVRRDLGFRSPTLLATVDAGVHDGEIFVVSEYVEGETLAGLLTAAGAEGLPTPVLLKILLDVTTAVAAGHALEKPAIHGEIGPSQIRVGVDGTARIGGFGAARALSKLSVQATKNADRLPYAAPERVKGMASTSAPQVALDPKADVFSLGVLLWEAIARQRLFASRIEAAVIQKVLTAPIAPLSSLPGVNVPPRMDDIVQRSLERDPSRRIASAGELLEALRNVGAGFLASQGEVAARLDKLVGKAVAERRMEIVAALGRKPASGAAVKRASSSAIKAVSAPAATPAASAAAKPAASTSAASAPKPSPAARPLPSPAAKTPAAAAASTPAVSAPAASAPATSTPATSAPAVSAPAKPASGVARSLPSRQQTMLGGLGPKGPPEPAKPKVAEPKAADPKPAEPKAPEPDPFSDSELDLAFADAPAKPAEAVKVEAKVEAPKPAVAKPAPLRAMTTRGGFGVSPTPSPRPAVAAPAAPSASAATPPAARAITKPQGSKEIPIHEATPAPVVEAKAKAAPAEVETKGPSSDQGTGTTPSTPRGRIAAAIDKVGPGSTLGRYEILAPIARGGMAEVWAARLQGSRGFQKLVAIKTMLSDVSDDPDFEEMFLDEAKVAARIRHPNVAEIMDLGEDNDVLYLVMEWIDGENLGTVIRGAKSLGGIPLPIVLRIASQACAGLHAAHELRDDHGHLVDLIHRDVSPANVLVSMTGFVKLVDFGVAKSKNRAHVTRAGAMVKGKTPYLSPEQLGQLPLDRRSDIFSFGVMLYVLLTGLHPFRAETESKTIENIALREPVSLHTINPKIPIEIERVVFKALQKDREKRYATASELGRALDQVAVSLGLPASDADVADFVRTIIGEAAQKRAQDIRAAIAALDGAAGAEPSKVDAGKAVSKVDAGKAEASKADAGKVEASKADAAEAAAPPVERKTPMGGVAVPKPAPKAAPEPLEEPLPTASTREPPGATLAVGDAEEISFDAELPSIDEPAAAKPAEEASPPSAREADLPIASAAPTPAVMGLPAVGLVVGAPPGAADDRTPSSSILDEETATAGSIVDGRARRSRTVAIVVGAAVGGIAVAAGFSLMFNRGPSSTPASGVESATALAVPAPSASQAPSAAAPPPAASTAAPAASVASPEPAASAAAPDVPLDPPLFAKGKAPLTGKLPPAKPGTGKAPPPPPPPTKPAAKPPKYTPTGI